eukprot:TRINITY_DN2904_c0_g1_i1.p1 TRINITY_DN2904_c0_g1~~TRINITY_DN2904_c0_g1_i1.p1  ORF type:complete len:206 (-),score=44.84 TRINITY_DN2904_c0_g1_i1:460-1047(-)
MPKIIVHFDPRYQHCSFPKYYASSLKGKINKTDYEELINKLSVGLMDSYSYKTKSLKSFFSKKEAKRTKVRKFENMIQREGYVLKRDKGIKLTFQFLDFRNNQLVFEWDCADDFEFIEKSSQYDCTVYCEKSIMHVYFEGSALGMNGLPEYGYGDSFGEFGEKYDQDIKDDNGETEIRFIHRKSFRNSVYLYKYI